MMHLHRSARIEDLAKRLADVLGNDPLHPMQSEWVAVPSDGMRRWLALELARHLGAGDPGRTDGIAAHIDFPFPGSLRNRVLDAHRGDDQPDPWHVDRLVWTILAVVEHHIGDPALRTFTALAPGASRYGKARRVADLFDRYHVHRSDMIRSWAGGHSTDGFGRPLPEHHAWQPHLWRLVRDLVGESSPPELMPGALEQVAAGSLDSGLPSRLSVFGVTSLPGGSSFLELSRALSVAHELHLFLLEPAGVGDEVVRSWQRAIPGSGPYPRVDESLSLQIRHPLSLTWGRLQRETTFLLASDVGIPAAEGASEVTPDLPGDALLQRLQGDIRGNRAPSGEYAVAPGDRSIQFHACFGLTRQVEVLRDAILHLLADTDLGLTEDDILVVAPALARSAALVEAVFGPSTDLATSVEHPGRAPGLRYRIADRSVRDFNQVLSAVSDLIALIEGRFEASALLGFFALLPVRTKYGFSDDDLAQINDWIDEAQVRWGLDPGQRQRLGVPATVETNTWQQALDRLLLGSSIFDRDDGLALGHLPIIGVEGSDVDTLGRMAELVRRLADLAEETLHPRPIGAWIELLRRAADDLLDMPDELEWQMGALWSLLDDVEASVPTPVSTDLEFTDIRRVFGDRLSAVPGRPDFFRGGITVSSLTPLRGIPFRVVCLLGMDESAFGSGAVDGDDVAAMAPVLGDPDQRGEVRLSLLEAVMAAQDHLIVLRDGFDVRTNRQIPRSVVVEELSDAILATVRSDDRAGLAERLEIQHPRQAFDERCFEAGALMPSGPWGFDAGDLAGAQATRRRDGAPVPFLAAPLPPVAESEIDLTDVQRFLRDPVKWFLEHRLGARLPQPATTVRDRLPVDLDALEKWKVGDRLLEALLNGTDMEEWVRIELRRGTLPNDALGDALIGDLAARVPALITAAESCGFSNRAEGWLPIEVVLADGTRLVGSVPNKLESPGAGPARILLSSTKEHQRVAASVDLLALVATDPSAHWRSLVVSRGKKGPHIRDLLPLDGGQGIGSMARETLEVVVDCYRRGCREPLPLFPNLSPKVFDHTAKATDWRSWDGRSDGDKVATALAYGDYDYRALLAVPARDADPPGPGNRVERYATYLYGALQMAVDTV